MLSHGDSVKRAWLEGSVVAPGLVAQYLGVQAQFHFGLGTSSFQPESRGQHWGFSLENRWLSLGEHSGHVFQTRVPDGDLRLGD